QAEREDKQQSKGDPEEQPESAGTHKSGSERPRMRAHRTRYDMPDKTVVTAAAPTSSSVIAPSAAPRPSRARTKPTSAICTAVLTLLMYSGSKCRGAVVDDWIRTKPPMIITSRKTTRITNQFGN